MRLVHQLSLLLITIALAAVAAVAGLVVWNLRAGFSDYLQAQDGEHLTRLMEAAERDLARRGGLPQDLRPVLREWLDAVRVSTGRGGPAEGPPPGGWPDDPPPPERGGPQGRQPPPELRRDPPPPRRDPSNFGPRVVVLAADGITPLAGRRETLDRPGQTRAVKLNGQTLAVLRLAERAGPAEGVDASFLRRQYIGLGLVAGGVLIVALVLARLLAVRWARPLAEAQVAARRIAAGEFDVRLPAPRDGSGASEIAGLHADINGMAEALQRLESSRQRWIAELSHKLRTPLAVLRGEVEALVDGIRPLDRVALGSLQEEIKRLSRLVEDFHLLATSELRSLPCEFEPVAPAALLQAALDRIAPRAKARGLVIEAPLPQVLPAARWDAVRVSQLLANLLENSLRYTEAPGLLQVAARPLGAAVEIRIEDTPPGVPEAELDRLFDPLYRADPSRSRAFGGSGLGLAIARAIAQAHGGRLRAEASSLGGLAMVLTLPLKPEGSP
ncbi:two-component system sensor histidine kinase BaeS [Pelomonas saccharophila]|uniref:histidine kinase n=1 Tax=Roseateles saccharophilus TaxID=304 RepID=A0ABU1YR63_ROSSA|nr:ATP-binding protein [Roseateles saccharophilus]MDR7271352.1 two-component system sensor histidine kinase BaeS [Roseateles saccharophilus]